MVSTFSSNKSGRYPPAKELSVVVPAYNEEARIAANLSRIHEHLSRSLTDESWELIAVDDGSLDQTGAVMERFAASHSNVRVLRHACNRGLGAALKTGVESAEGSCVVTLDSDLSYAPSLITSLSEEWRRSGAAVVLASPYMRGGNTQNVPATRLLLSVWANRLLSLASGGRIKTFTGMVRAYDHAFLRGLAWPTVGNINVGILLHAQRMGANVSEIPAELAWPQNRGTARLSYQRIGHEVMSVILHSIDFAWTRISR